MSENKDITDDGTVSPQKRLLPKHKVTFGTHKGIIDDGLDKNHLYTFPNPLIRIEYPANVKNVNRAIQTLGGMHEIQKCADGNSKLELKFHPKNQYNKGCIADKNNGVGILIKIIQSDHADGYSYEIINVTNVNFKFNRMCDFQYLPLVSKDTPETQESEVEYLYDKIIPNEIPTLDWLKRNETTDMSVVLISSNFAKFDMPQVRFQTDATKTFLSLIRPGEKMESNVARRKATQSFIPSCQINFSKPDIEVPHQATTFAMKFIKEKKLERHYALVNGLFQKRPIWRKAAVIYQTGLLENTVKLVLPSVACYCTHGPWRACWIRFGYNPIQDFNSRIYQVLDFRISSKGMQLKVKAKKGNVANILRNNLTEGTPQLENEYVLRPNCIPPARQMFYQYCDILIPEIQEMLSKLPKLPANAKCDIKNGWLPLNFTEYCREICNKCILDAVQKELLSEARGQNTNLTEGRTELTGNIVSLYCSKMLSNIKKGKSTEPGGSQEQVKQIDLVNDENEIEQIDANEIVNSLPERMIGGSEDEDSDMDIDMDAVEEIKEIVSQN